MNLFEQQASDFTNRHIGSDEKETSSMLKTIGVRSIGELIERTIPASIRLKQPLKTEAPVSEFEYLEELKTIASKNKIFKSYIGQGYYDTIIPAVLLRNLF